MTTANPAIGRPSGPAPSLRRKASRGSILADRAATVVLWGTGFFVLLLLGSIIVHFAVAAWGVVSPSFILDDPSDTVLGGIMPVLWNSIYILVLTMLIAVPIGILGGIYMSEYAAENAVTNAIRFAEEAISSVPSIDQEQPRSVCRSPSRAPPTHTAATRSDAVARSKQR